jgi:hypothetical protein
MSEREITIREVADELQLRLERGKTVDCCKDELLRLCEIVKEKIGNEKIRVNWQD